MTPQRQLKRNLRTITWTLMAMGIGVTLLFGVIFLHARRDQAQLVERQLVQHKIMIELQGAIGYGGMIHNFKNWVLRPGETRYRDAALASANRALGLLDQLEGEADKANLDVSLDVPRATIHQYLDQIATVDHMHRDGASARQIDQAVRISDDEALGELAALRARLVENMRVQQAALEDRKALVLLLPSMLIVVLAFGLLLLVRQRARLRFEFDATRLDEMEQFTQIAVHDLRAPLRQISTLAEFAQEELDSGEPDAQGLIAEHLETIMERARKLDALVKAVFRYILIEGAAEEITNVDLRQMIGDLVELHVPEGGKAVLEGDFPVIRAQHVELEIILRNLISNAVKHHPLNKPTIILRHSIDGHCHRFEVQDDGPGIDEKNAAKVFDMFWSLKGAQNPEEVSGVGLALVRRIVMRWGTDLALRKAEPSGAVFTFTMPVF